MAGVEALADSEGEHAEPIGETTGPRTASATASPAVLGLVNTTPKEMFHEEG